MFTLWHLGASSSGYLKRVPGTEIKTEKFLLKRWTTARPPTSLSITCQTPSDEHVYFMDFDWLMAFAFRERKRAYASRVPDCHCEGGQVRGWHYKERESPQ